MHDRLRGANGKYIDMGHNVDVEHDQAIARHNARNCSKSPAGKSPRLRGKACFPVDSIHLVDDENREVIEKTCASTYLNAKAFIWALKLLYCASKIIAWLALIMLTKIVTAGNVAGSLTMTLIRCFLGKEEADSSCYSKIDDVLFPLDQAEDSSHVSFKISDSNLATATSIYELGFSLSANNPLMFAGILLFSVIGVYSTAYFHNVLVETAELAAAISPSQALKQKYGGTPSLI